MIRNQIFKVADLFEFLSEVCKDENTDLEILYIKFDGTYIKCICKGEKNKYLINNLDNHKNFKMKKY